MQIDAVPGRQVAGRAHGGVKLTGHILVADKGDYYPVEGCMPAGIHPGSPGRVNPDPA